MKPFQKCHGGIHVTARQELPLLVKNHRDQHWQVAVLFRCQHGRLRLKGVAHRLNEHQIRASSRATTHHLAEDFDRAVKGQVAHRSQKFARGADVQRDVCILPTSASHRLAHMPNRRRHDFAHVIEFQCIGAESVGVDDVTASP